MVEDFAEGESETEQKINKILVPFKTLLPLLPVGMEGRGLIKEGGGRFLFTRLVELSNILIVKVIEEIEEQALHAAALWSLYFTLLYPLSTIPETTKLANLAVGLILE